MNIAVLIGFLIANIGVFVGMIFKGADPVQLFTNIAAIMVVGMGMFGAVWTSHTMEDNMAALKATKKLFTPGKPVNGRETIDQLVAMSEKARREGLLGLEDMTKNMEDPFLKKGVQMIVDGADAASVYDTLSVEVKAMKERHKAVAGWYTAAGVFAPSFGILGAVIGLIAVMAKLDDPAALGHGIAAAFVATFWGVFWANALFLPWGAQLKRLSTAEAAHKEMIIQGIIALQSGVAPRALNDRLSGYLPPAQREAS
jgi:chemotaxis protein MotA